VASQLVKNLAREWANEVLEIERAIAFGSLKWWDRIRLKVLRFLLVRYPYAQHRATTTQANGPARPPHQETGLEQLFDRQPPRDSARVHAALREIHRKAGHVREEPRASSETVAKVQDQIERAADAAVRTGLIALLVAAVVVMLTLLVLPAIKGPLWL